MEFLKDRLRFARKEAGLNQTELAERSGLKQSDISKLERGDSLSTTKMAELAAALGVNSLWLATGDGPMQALERQAGSSNVSTKREFSGEVPVISWIRAGTWHEAADSFQPGEADRFLPIVRGHSSNTFALKVRGDSMTAPHGRTYPEGCFIVVDPAKCSPVNGDRIVAKLDGTDEATFKIYKEEDGRRWLAPLNPMHPPIFEPFKVIGTVISKFEDE